MKPHGPIGSVLAISLVSLGTLVCSFMEPATAAVLMNGWPSGGLYVCADVAADSNVSGTNVQAWACHAGPNQQFSIEPGASAAPSVAGGLIIYALGGTMCVSVADAQNFSAGTTALIVPCTVPWTGAIWQYTPLGQLLELHTLPNSLCLDATDRQNGTSLVLNPCISGEGQWWVIY
jgi:hypothetical protein